MKNIKLAGFICVTSCDTVIGKGISFEEIKQATKDLGNCSISMEDASNAMQQIAEAGRRQSHLFRKIGDEFKEIELVETKTVNPNSRKYKKRKW